MENIPKLYGKVSIVCYTSWRLIECINIYQPANINGTAPTCLAKISHLQENFVHLGLSTGRPTQVGEHSQYIYPYMIFGGAIILNHEMGFAK